MQTTSDWLPLTLAILLYLARVREFFVKRNLSAGQVNERATFYALLASGTLVVTSSIVEYLVRHLHFNTLTFAAGLLVAAASFLIRAAAVRALGKMWSVHIEIRKEHQLVKSGPFRWVRHPIYLAAILELVGAMLITNAAYTSIIFVLGFIPSLYFRILLEERAMIQQFGPQYKDYIRTTPAVFPYRGPVS